MSDPKRKGSGTFKKRAHRPWKTALLESTVQEAALEADDDLFAFDVDIDLDTAVDSDSFYPEFNFTDEIGDVTADLSALDLDTRVQLDEEKSEIKQAIQQTKQQHKQLMQQINQDKTTNSLLLGGFFQPQQISANNETQTGRKINSLLSDLKVREQKISSLTSNLKISEAYERAEQAELSKRAANQQLQAAENRLHQAVQQANMAEEQFLTAMEQAKQAALAHQEESKLRREAETQAKEARVRANNAEIELQNERLARIAADEKAQHAFMLAEKASLFQRQLAETSEQLVRLEGNKKADDSQRIELQQKFEKLTADYQAVQAEHKQCATTIAELQANIEELNTKYKSTAQLSADFNAEREKLKSIISAEQDLRKHADRKYQEALQRAEKAEQGWQSEKQQRKLIEERAKRAVANASRTVLHLLNTPGDADLVSEQMPQPSVQKSKIRVPAADITSSEFDYEEDDLLF